jgi:hypothetical protein
MAESAQEKQIKLLRAQLKIIRTEGNEFYDKMNGRKCITMWTYPKEKLNCSWMLSDLWDRTMAAQALGWDVIIDADEKGIHVRYAEKLPTSRPNSFFY